MDATSFQKRPEGRPLKNADLVASDRQTREPFADRSLIGMAARDNWLPAIRRARGPGNIFRSQRVPFLGNRATVVLIALTSDR